MHPNKLDNSKRAKVFVLRGHAGKVGQLPAVVQDFPPKLDINPRWVLITLQPKA